MTDRISHHIPTEIVAAYAAGSLEWAFSLVVAAHLSLCDSCRAELEAQEAAGGAVLEGIGTEKVSDGLLEKVMGALDSPAGEDAPKVRGNDIYPAPVMAALNGKLPKWKSVGGGVRQCVVGGDRNGVARLLFIPPGRAVPDHGHNGMELTLVLQGGFSDETGHFDVGDVEVADAALVHVPTADPGQPCIVIAATDAPLNFKGFLPRLVQPLFGI